MDGQNEQNPIDLATPDIIDLVTPDVVAQQPPPVQADDIIDLVTPDDQNAEPVAPPVAPHVGPIAPPAQPHGAPFGPLEEVTPGPQCDACRLVAQVSRVVETQVRPIVWGIRRSLDPSEF
eukprot:284393_1